MTLNDVIYSVHGAKWTGGPSGFLGSKPTDPYAEVSLESRNKEVKKTSVKKKTNRFLLSGFFLFKFFHKSFFLPSNSVMFQTRLGRNRELTRRG